MNPGPYHLFAIPLLLLGSYLFSLLAVQRGLMGRGAHRKFWNSLLLVFFLSIVFGVKMNPAVNGFF